MSRDTGTDDPGPELLDLEAWVEEAGSTRAEREIRRAIQTTVVAIAMSSSLRDFMIIKGGVLLAARYGTMRHTKDVDFSTHSKFGNFDVEKFVEELDARLSDAVVHLDLGLHCRVQSREVRPANPDRNYQTLHLSVGYAAEGSRQMRHLLRGQAPDTIKLDLSFNEHVTDVDVFEITPSSNILAYSICDQIAEKFRAIIQQAPERRGRVREQDAYDIFMVLRQGILSSPIKRAAVHKALLQSCRSRDIEPTREMIREPEVRARAERDYHQLGPTVPEPLPNFDDLFEVVIEFYESLPW